MTLSLVPPPPISTTVQFVITPHPEKFIVGMMYCVLERKLPLSVLPAGGKEGTSHVPIVGIAMKKMNRTNCFENWHRDRPYREVSNDVRFI